MDEQGHAGDQSCHQTGQWVGHQSKPRLKTGDLNPGNRRGGHSPGRSPAAQQHHGSDETSQAGRHRDRHRQPRERVEEQANGHRGNQRQQQDQIWGIGDHARI